MTGPEDDQDREQVRSVSGDDLISDSLASPVLGTEDDGAISDQMLQDLMPDLDLPSIDDYLPLPEFETRTGLQKTHSYPFGLLSSPDQSNLLLNGTGSFIKSMRRLNPADTVVVCRSKKLL
jgi:hypothetical protein